MTPEEAWLLQAKAMPEKTLQAQVERIARGYDWLVFHDGYSRRSQAGFPDLCLVRGGRLVFAELKAHRGTFSEQQKAWLEELEVVRSRAPGVVDVYRWKPYAVLSGDIERVLR